MKENEGRITGIVSIKKYTQNINPNVMFCSSKANNKHEGIYTDKVERKNSEG